MSNTTNVTISAWQDECPIEWLISLRQWGAESGTGGFSRFQTVPWGIYEDHLGIPNGKVARWWRNDYVEHFGDSEWLNKVEYLCLCPLLYAWHGYEPPTDEWRNLMRKH